MHQSSRVNPKKTKASDPCHWDWLDEMETSVMEQIGKDEDQDHQKNGANSGGTVI